MVGRLVEDEHFRLGHQCLCQGHTFAHTAGERTHQCFRVKLKALNSRLDTRLHRPTVLRFECSL
jgi:hypothetical protein